MTQKNLMLKFCDYLETCYDEKYFFCYLNVSLAPVLHRLKTGNVMTIKDGKRKLFQIYMQNKKRIEKITGLSSYVLRLDKNTATVYFYNKKMLCNLLRSKKINAYLEQAGYDISYKSNIDELVYLNHLRERFNETCPSEVGIFLGYPLRDVIDFEKSNKTCKCIGYWKCFNNAKNAKKTFRKYDYAKAVEIKKIIS